MISLQQKNKFLFGISFHTEKNFFSVLFTFVYFSSSESFSNFGNIQFLTFSSFVRFKFRSVETKIDSVCSRQNCWENEFYSIYRRLVEWNEIVGINQTEFSNSLKIENMVSPSLSHSLARFSVDFFSSGLVYLPQNAYRLFRLKFVLVRKRCNARNPQCSFNEKSW